jgi:hypothetical protein
MGTSCSGLRQGEADNNPREFFPILNLTKPDSLFSANSLPCTADNKKIVMHQMLGRHQPAETWHW